MNVPIEIVTLLLGALITSLVSISKRINRIEKNLLVIVTMLRDRGLKIPTTLDTDRIFKQKDF